MGEAHHGKPNQIMLYKILFLDSRHCKKIILAALQKKFRFKKIHVSSVTVSFNMLTNSFFICRLSNEL